jgi:hypothetical protein
MDAEKYSDLAETIAYRPCVDYSSRYSPLLFVERAKQGYRLYNAREAGIRVSSRTSSAFARSRNIAPMQAQF